MGGKQSFALRTQRATVTDSESLEIVQKEWGWGGILLEEETPGCSPRSLSHRGFEVRKSLDWVSESSLAVLKGAGGRRRAGVGGDSQG